MAGRFVEQDCRDFPGAENFLTPVLGKNAVVIPAWKNKFNTLPSRATPPAAVAT
ncbi:MAG: hypothetical protein ACOY3X_03385 [Pseudomonadota bacterium]